MSQNKPAWAKRGQSTSEAIEAEKARLEEGNKSKANRFWMRSGTTQELTFLDGDLTENGVLDAVIYREHSYFQNGNWRNWTVCLADEGDCPLCDSSGKEGYLAAAFTVIDHSSFKTKAGKLIEDTRKLLVCKIGVLEQLQQIAAENGGLTGLTLKVSRTSGEAAATGDEFSVISSTPIEEINKSYPDLIDRGEMGVFDYEKVISYKSAKEMNNIISPNKSRQAAPTSNYQTQGFSKAMSNDDFDDDIPF